MTATTLSPREMKRLRKQGADYVSPSPYTVRAAFRRGDLFTKLSAVVFGLGDIVRKQYVKGIAMLALEIAYFVFMAINGVDYLSKLPTLGTNAGGKKLVDGFWVYTEPDRSVVILLYGVATLVITAAFIGLWVMSVRSAYKSQVLLEENGKAPSFMDDVRELLDAKAHVLLMFLPTLGIVVFTVLPLIFMIQWHSPAMTTSTSCCSTGSALRTSPRFSPTAAALLTLHCSDACWCGPWSGPSSPPS